jgi:hypothetical protein
MLKQYAVGTTEQSFAAVIETIKRDGSVTVNIDVRIS